MMTILRTFIVLAIIYGANEDYEKEKWDRIIARTIGLIALVAYVFLMERKG